MHFPLCPFLTFTIKIKAKVMSRNIFLTCI